MMSPRFTTNCSLHPFLFALHLIVSTTGSINISKSLASKCVEKTENVARN